MGLAYAAGCDARSRCEHGALCGPNSGESGYGEAGIVGGGLAYAAGWDACSRCEHGTVCVRILANPATGRRGLLVWALPTLRVGMLARFASMGWWCGPNSGESGYGEVPVVLWP